MRLALTHVYCWPDVVRGGERFLHEVAGAMARRGHEVTILSSSRTPGRATLEDVVRIVRLRPPKGETAIEREAAFGRRVVVPLIRGRYDAVHSLGPSDAAASLSAASLHRRRRTVFTNLGIPTRSYWDRRPDHRAHVRVVRGIDAYGCMSAHAARTLEHEYGRRAVLTPGGVRLARFAPARVREPRPTLLYTGALIEPRKGVSLLLDAVALLAREVPDVRLWLNGPGREEVRHVVAAAPAAARERTELLPSQPPDAQGGYPGRAWATVLPSVNEAFGMVLVESLACGTPIVGLDDSALPELVSPDVGALARPGDPASLAHACAEALELARKAETVEACRAAATPYDWDTALAPRLEEIYAGADCDGPATAN